MDSVTPRNVYLTAFYSRSNALLNNTTKVPENLKNTIRHIKTQERDLVKKYGQDGLCELQVVYKKLFNLYKEILTDKPFRELQSEAPDVEFWNNYLIKMDAEDCRPSFMKTIRLYAECYVYRRFWEAFELTSTLNDFDPFERQKKDQYYSNIQKIKATGMDLTDILEDQLPENELKNFQALVRLNLWANKADLTMPKHKVSEGTGDMPDLYKMEPKIVCDQSEKMWEIVSEKEGSKQNIDFILDNAGPELFTDLCLADLFIQKKYADTVRFYVKSIPWFISDVMEKDIHWMMEKLSNRTEKHMKELGETWRSHFSSKRWIIITNMFWNLPCEFTNMRKIDPDLYMELMDSKLLIIKGDLSYRKLFGERNWGPSTPLETALQGFGPSNMCAIRIMKCDLVCGLAEGLAELLDMQDPTWMVNGLYGVIQFAKKNKYPF